MLMGTAVWDFQDDEIVLELETTGKNARFCEHRKKNTEWYTLQKVDAKVCEL